MRMLIIVTLCLSFAAVVTAAQEPSASPTPSASPAQVDSPMVRAAKASSSAAGSKNRIKISNEDVKKSKGKLTIVSAKPMEAAPKEAAQPKDGSAVEKFEKEQAHKAAQTKLEAAEKRVETLTKALNAAEEAYYTAEDPAVRDMIEQRFIQAKQDLDSAKRDVDTARGELNKTE